MLHLIFAVFCHGNFIEQLNSFLRCFLTCLLNIFLRFRLKLFQFRFDSFSLILSMFGHYHSCLSKLLNEKLQNMNICFTHLLWTFLSVVLIEQLELFYIFANPFILVVFNSTIDVFKFTVKKLLGSLDIFVLVLGFDYSKLAFGTLCKLLFILLSKVIVWC